MYVRFLFGLQWNRETIMMFERKLILKSRIALEMAISDTNQDLCLGLDLIRCESLQSLDPGTASKLLNKNYS